MELVLFDLDDTLIRTSDLEGFRGRENAVAQSHDYVAELERAYRVGFGRHLYGAAHLNQLKEQRPGRKLGVFTRAPRQYALTLLGLAYPGFEWDVIVAYGDVAHTKPHPDGILHAMALCGVQQVHQVTMVGDNKVDLQAAYNAGCWAVLDRASWPRPWANENYRALEKVPDAFISAPAELFRFVADPGEFLPELERTGWGGAPRANGSFRDDRANYFNPLTPDVHQPTSIHFLGRFFTQESPARAAWHRLNQEIIQHKDSTVFPAHWIASICTYLDSLPAAQSREGLVVTVVPAKPGRVPRLESMLGQLAQVRAWPPRVEFIPDLLRYDPGVRSHSGDHLNREQRFQNVRDFLRVNRVEAAAQRRIVVIDDVVTTGASLLYAKIYLETARASEVICLSLAKAINSQ
ncbi:HAD-IA family hydrolase [Pseudomonas nitroreducens]|uniref:HAD-IA family hydrolase n=1 Tax=Pseudomonas nitroreducens TaxID=46680 RepID=UPI00345F8962|nr:HAD superfamily hydrolase (TIGR01549 family) [Pseudomonas nitroreducens]MCP1684605.1 HAD superfamily hydrolase (TIGR01549 family) [Pseudomonas nitroreducens]